MLLDKKSAVQFEKDIFGAKRYECYDELIAEHPVYWCESVNSFLISRFNDVAKCVRSDTLTTERLVVEKIENLKDGESDFFKEIIDVISTWMIYNDKPVHTRLRKFMNRAFMKKELDAIVPEISKLTMKVITKVKSSDKSEFDFVKDIAHPLPAMILCKMLGLHEDNVDTFIKWSDDIANFMQDFVVSPIPDSDIAEVTKNSMREMFNFLHTTIKSRRKHPENDLISRLVNNDQEASDTEALTDAEVAAQTIHLIFGGHKIPQFMLSNTLNSLFLNPLEMERVREDNSRLYSLLEESMRYEGPIQFITRHVSKDFELHGVELKKGDSVFLMLGAANRDKNIFKNADKFIPDREDKTHLAFGGGHHNCIGAAFVRIEMGIIFKLLINEFKLLDPLYNIEDPEWTDNPTFHGITTMPIKVK